MARTYIIVAMCVITACSNNSISADNVPSVVMNTLQTNYTAKEVEWEKVDSMYIAEFDLNDTTDVEVRISSGGRVIGEKKEIDSAQLAPLVMNTIRTRFPGYRIDDAETVTINGNSYYQIELAAKSKKDVQLVVGKDGEAMGIRYWD